MLLCVILGIAFLTILQDFAVKRGGGESYSPAHLGRELHTASFSLLLPSYFVNIADPWILGALLFSLMAFGLTAICIYGAEGKFGENRSHFERIGFTVGMIFIFVGGGAAFAIWP